MRYVILNGAAVKSRGELYDALERYMDLPDYFGRNLDALHDVLLHEILPAVTRETGVLLRFLAGIRRIPLTIVRDAVTPNDYLAENLRCLRAIAADPYVAGCDIVGEEINDILELKALIRELVRIAKKRIMVSVSSRLGALPYLANPIQNSSTSSVSKVPTLAVGMSSAKPR